MSTRAQVYITSSGLPWSEEPQLLYHHTDGYPEYMLPKIVEAFRLGESQEWRLGRVGKAASFLCAVDPGVFEPEALAEELHCDIEFFYHIHIVNKKDNSGVRWIVSANAPSEDFYSQPTRKNMIQLGAKYKLTPGQRIIDRC